MTWYVTYDHNQFRIYSIFMEIDITIVEPLWRSGRVMDCHATARGSIPCVNGVKTELHVLHKGQ